MEVPFKPYYQDDAVTIYCADCRQVLPFLPKHDLLLTDPPYGIGIARRGTIGTSKAGKVKDYGKSNWDDEPPAEWVLGLAMKTSHVQVLWGGNFYDGLPPSSCWYVWDKDNTGDFADCELAWTSLSSAVRKFKFRWNGMLQERMGDDKEHRVHPTQKPTPLMRWCLSQVPDAQTILDPFAGSGTTGVAAKLEGRKATLIEINEAYCESAAKRLSQGVLF